MSKKRARAFAEFAAKHTWLKEGLKDQVDSLMDQAVATAADVEKGLGSILKEGDKVSFKFHEKQVRGIVAEITYFVTYPFSRSMIYYREPLIVLQTEEGDKRYLLKDIEDLEFLE